ncbi:MAG: enoyl-CoA hydratase [Cycloclasticus sp. symbiont of Poecilosclerida sp. M]|nr:MAG: enoyl-CoA hydratase [Cycloclasticus sp. symbiont of Poecilosclerida sp. M]
MAVVEIIKEGPIAQLVLNRPEKLNVLNVDMPAELKKCTEELKNVDDIRCVIVKGAGDHFMAGGDIDYFKSLADAYAKEGEPALPDDLFDILHGAILNITHMNKPVIASVQGAVAGFGLSLMLSCDVVIAADNAVLSAAYCKIGLTPDGGVTYSLPRAVGQKKAMELLLTGQRFTAEQGEQWGMINQVVPADLLHAKTLELATQLSDGPSDVLARTKKLLNQSSDVSLNARLDDEADNFYSSMQRADFYEGVTSFCEKRPAKFNKP